MDGGRAGGWKMIVLGGEGRENIWMGDFGKSTSWWFTSGLWIGWGLVTVTTSRAITTTSCCVVEEA